MHNSSLADADAVSLDPSSVLKAGRDGLELNVQELQVLGGLERGTLETQGSFTIRYRVTYTLSGAHPDPLCTFKERTGKCITSYMLSATPV